MKEYWEITLMWDDGSFNALNFYSVGFPTKKQLLEVTGHRDYVILNISQLTKKAYCKLTETRENEV